MKSLTILAVAAALTCVVSAAEIQHHGGFDHIDHDFGKNGYINNDGKGGHDDHDKVGHTDHDGKGGFSGVKNGYDGGKDTYDEHGRDPIYSPPEEPNYEIQTKPPVVVLKTVTLTKPWAIAHATPKVDPPAYPAAKDPSTYESEGRESEGRESEDRESEAHEPKGFDHDNSEHERTHANHDRAHDIYHDRDHSKSHSRARVRQKGRIEGVRVNAVASKPAAAVEPAAESEKPLAAAAVSASPAASKPSKMSSAAAAAVTQSSTASTRVNVVNSAADHLRIGGSLVAAAAGVAAWLLL
ncbi:hypothetical protein G6F46_006065 [Rhizopus delemar]|uniref:Uncharacterized protein n=3 Tax=Rhizopus TaxID=4842 RepID=I1BX07_RHIO9|nr:hypothetical protein RO3G_05442 [Rhizopus delemar RA 99-880]KAG1448944.1 hypothetical protein G6F55_010403 [Rhizopus delemar]KAG1546664.1 hypothetical protein G6F51_004742 [Rhizopus arrhizus]KAG1503498.1 hypothetical protein G6F54_001632 [Rhizopus delemar]KAG1509231.1 hypothetical protein G6F52_011184 [Rhizopus delemar]|eukprot:EIE80737.1 hypothetical protein RO3G_05442 [Rhizopus delemar RA 99-880]